MEITQKHMEFTEKMSQSVQNSQSQNAKMSQSNDTHTVQMIKDMSENL